MIFDVSMQAAEEVDESLQNNAAATNYGRTSDFGQTFNSGDSFGAGVSSCCIFTHVRELRNDYSVCILELWSAFW